MRQRVRWGILGTATIAREAVIPAMTKSPCAEVAELVAIASREPDKAREFAQQWKIPQAYGSYEELLASADIDAVYVPLPNHLHVPLTLRALECGKHVLCEKPIALSADEAMQLLAATAKFPHLQVMEAFMYRFHPQWEWALQMVRAQRIGRLRTIHTFFSFFDDSPASILHHAEWGGGALMDIGCYPISLARYLIGREPERVWGDMGDRETFGVDRLTLGVLDFGDVKSTFTAATNTALHQRVSVFGEKGRLELEIPFNAPADCPARGWLEVDESVNEVTFPPCDQYAIQMARFSDAVLQNTPLPTSLEDAVANMRAIDALVRSSRRGTWEKV